MKEKASVTSITFRQTANLFVNIGIVALHRFLKKFEQEYPQRFPSLSYSFDDKKLVVNCDQLLSLLEDLYYFMGEAIYDTPTEKQLNENANIYYIETEDRFKHFPKMNTYGLTHLLTNNAQGVTRHKDNAPKFKNLKKERPEIASRIEAYYERKGHKLLSKVYLNEPYTKITRLDVDEKYLLPGTQVCPVTGESYKTLVEAKNVSPFVSGLANFNSFLNNSEKKISWKAMYLIRFAPALCLYAYQNSYETLICNFFNSNNLQNLDDLHETDMYRIKDELAQINYRINFRMADFKVPRKGAEDLKIETTRDAVWESEIAFMLLYTFYRKHFWKKAENQESEKTYADPFASHPLEDVPITLVAFRADKFASTLRPNYYEEYNHVKFVIQLISALEKSGVTISTIWQSLRLSSPKTQTIKKQDYAKGVAAERQTRSEVLRKVLKGKSVVDDIERLFFKCYKLLLAKETVGFKNYTKLLDFLSLYEKAIKFGNHKIMNEQLQQRAINLGKSLGNGIIHFDHPKDDNEQKANAKSGRKYIIRLHKARTLEQFTEALISLMKKYNISISGELLENLNDKNFLLIRQYTVISALNVLNWILSSSKNND
jgi:hypothetical protein